MSIEQLIKRRYKVIAQWPLCPYELNSIIEECCMKGSDTCYYDEWPHLFRKLEWWEERKPEEMPLYIKEIDSLSKIGEVIKVKEWYMEDIDTDVPCFMDEKDNHFTWVRGFIPATEQEYLTYINSKK